MDLSRALDAGTIANLALFPLRFMAVVRRHETKLRVVKMLSVLRAADAISALVGA